jgi:hypothetical protein
VIEISNLHHRWRKDSDYKDAHDALGEEFDLARSLIEARTAARLSQSRLAKNAKKMKTSRHTSRGSRAKGASID